MYVIFVAFNVLVLLKAIKLCYILTTCMCFNVSKKFVQLIFLL